MKKYSQQFENEDISKKQSASKVCITIVMSPFPQLNPDMKIGALHVPLTYPAHQRWNEFLEKKPTYVLCRNVTYMKQHFGSIQRGSLDLAKSGVILNSLTHSFFESEMKSCVVLAVV